jgi:hypothetical protein
MSHQRLYGGDKKARKILNDRESSWPSYTLTPEERKKVKGILRNTRKTCSCWMCSNKRKREGPPIREIKQLDTEEIDANRSF